MSEDTARALGAASPTILMIDGKECQPRPLKSRELAEVQREGVRMYKKEYMRTYAESMRDLYPDDVAERKIDKKADEVSAWDVPDLPAKITYDPSTIRSTDKLRDWLTENFGEEGTFTTDAAIKFATVACLEAGILSGEEYQNLTGTEIKKYRISYIQWWTTGSMDGKIAMVWVAFKHYGVTKDQVIEALEKDKVKAEQVAKEIAELSAPGLGN